MDTLLGPLVTADEACAAVEASLRAALPAAAADLGLTAIQEWQQVPTDDALTSAAVPAVAISSPGDAREPRRTAAGYEIPYRVSVAIFDRGENHGDTQRRIRIWAALLTAALAQNQTLGGFAKRLTVIEQRIADPGRGAARTLGGCSVSVDIEPAALAVPHVAAPLLPGSGPTVQSTSTTTSVR
jgi:hypothetical protein